MSPLQSEAPAYHLEICWRSESSCAGTGRTARRGDPLGTGEGGYKESGPTPVEGGTGESGDTVLKEFQRFLVMGSGTLSLKGSDGIPFPLSFSDWGFHHSL